MPLKTFKPSPPHTPRIFTCAISKEEATRETAKNFAEAESFEIRVLATYENADTVAGELHIVVDGRIDLYLADVVTFNAQGCITAIRSYKGRGDGIF